ncbi:RNA 2',3'-cyclic phosphodiesterase [Desulfovibrio sp. OttesenSCG-928-A18]|nr:RNA 2',3'-cyclic phosphodiesterase [Desulfovibrio sp. OttesenSCG-928-A18]
MLQVPANSFKAFQMNGCGVCNGMTQALEKEIMQRLFVAITLPDTVRQLLLERQTELSDIRWTSPDNLHLTLRFIGEVPLAKVSVIKAGLRTVSENAFSLQVKGLGYFDKRPQAIVWAGVVESALLLALKKQVDDALALHAELKVPDGRFSPHITLGRAKRAGRSALKNFIAKYDDATTAAFTVKSFTLFNSVLAPGGAVHTAEERYPLVNDIGKI